MKRRIFLGLLSAAVVAPSGFCSQQYPDFTGNWKQSNERSTPRRTGNVTLRIDHRDPELTIETAMLRASAAPRHAVQHYTTDGKVSISTGIDGDEFHTGIVWKGQSLVFSIEEHEDGKILLSRETWTLMEDGATLERIHEPLPAPSDGAGKRTLIYLREAPQSLKREPD
jgi:hypothetical protein